MDVCLNCEAKDRIIARLEKQASCPHASQHHAVSEGSWRVTCLDCDAVLYDITSPSQHGLDPDSDHPGESWQAPDVDSTEYKKSPRWGMDW